jgi:hypothetical protein
MLKSQQYPFGRLFIVHFLEIFTNSLYVYIVASFFLNFITQNGA